MEKLRIGTLGSVKFVLERVVIQKNNINDQTFMPGYDIDDKTLKWANTENVNNNDYLRIICCVKSPHKYGIISGWGTKFEGVITNSGTYDNNGDSNPYLQNYLLHKLSRFVYKIRFNSRGQEYFTFPKYFDPFVPISTGDFYSQIFDRQIDFGGWKTLKHNENAQYEKHIQWLKDIAYAEKCKKCGKFVGNSGICKCGIKLGN